MIEHIEGYYVICPICNKIFDADTKEKAEYLYKIHLKAVHGK